MFQCQKTFWGEILSKSKKLIKKIKLEFTSYLRCNWRWCHLVGHSNWSVGGLVLTGLFRFPWQAIPRISALLMKFPFFWSFKNDLVAIARLGESSSLIGWAASYIVLAPLLTVKTKNRLAPLLAAVAPPAREVLLESSSFLTVEMTLNMIDVVK